MNTSSSPIRSRLLLLSVGAALVLSGCATRPPREVGPPSTPLMPPPPGNLEEDLPPPIMVEPLPVVSAPLAPEPMDPTVVTPVPEPALAPREGTPYTIKKGESLSAIAARYKINWMKLAEYNRIANPDKVREGQVILIPGSAAPSSAPRNLTPPRPANSGNTYVVQSGDNLTVIARRYGTTVAGLKSLNNLRSDRLLVGQILKVPEGSTPSAPVSRPAAPAPRVDPAPLAPPPTPEPVLPTLEPEPVAPVAQVVQEDPLADEPFTIVVEQGDTLESIAADYVISVDKIREINGLAPGEEIKAGQKLKMPFGVY